MCRRLVLFFVFFAATNTFAQDSTTPPPAPSAQEKAQALTALAAARNALFPLRRKDEARQLVGRVATLLAIAGDTASAQEVLTLLPANQRDAIQQEIVAAHIRSGELAAALETATAIPADDSKAAALLLIVQAQAKAQDFSAAMRTTGLISSGHVESVQALIEIAKQQKAAKKNGEATQLLRRAAAMAANVASSNGDDSECGLSLLAQVAKAQESIGESVDAVKTLQLAEGRVLEADPACRSTADRYMQDQDSDGKSEALQSETAQFRDRLTPSVSADVQVSEDQSEEDPPATDGAAADSGPTGLTTAQTRSDHFVLDNSWLQASQFIPNQTPLTREQAQAALDSLRTVKPLTYRAHTAMGTSALMLANGETDEAEEALHIGLAAADTIQDESLRGMLLASKVRARAAAKDWEAARAVLEEITDEAQRTAALVDLASRAAENGHPQLALSWAAAEPSPLSEAKVLVSVAEALLHQPRQQIVVAVTY